MTMAIKRDDIFYRITLLSISGNGGISAFSTTQSPFFQSLANTSISRKSYSYSTKLQTMEVNTKW